MLFSTCHFHWLRNYFNIDAVPQNGVIMNQEVIPDKNWKKINHKNIEVNQI